MNNIDVYRNRVNHVRASGTRMRDELQNASKRKALNDILNSPTLTHVRLNNDTRQHPTIVSDKETFNKRTVLFTPDTVLKVGDYVYYEGLTYLATDQKMDAIYPQLYIELCNETFIFKTTGTRTVIGYDEFGRPIYQDASQIEHRIPCVMTTKIYSIVENSAIPLPDGAMIIKIPYNPQLLPTVNYQYNYRTYQFKVTTISFENVINEIGYIEMRLQRET